MNKQTKKSLQQSRQEEAQLIFFGRAFIVYVACQYIYIVNATFNGSAEDSLIPMVLISGLLAVALLYLRKTYIPSKVTGREVGLVLSWLLFVCIFYAFEQLSKSNSGSDAGIYAGIASAVMAVAAYSFSVAVLWGVKSRSSPRKNVPWKESLIDAPYYRPGIALALTGISLIQLYNGFGIPSDILFDKEYETLARTIGAINLVIALAAVILSIISTFKVKTWLKIIFIISTLVGLYVVGLQTFSILLIGADFSH